MRLFPLFGPVLLGGCLVGSADATFDSDNDEGDPEEPRGSFGVIETPRHGDVVSGDTARTAIAFSGVHESPDYEIELQLLEDPNDLDSWITAAVAVTGSEPDGESLYAWSAVIDPAFDGDLTRWPQGGLLRLRARGEQGELLTRLYARPECSDTDPIRDRAAACGDVVDSGLVVVSPVAGLADDPLERPGFLLDKGVGTPDETDAYYLAINAPLTADDFRTRFGFDPATDVVATYFNRGDLATGREVRCRPFTENGVTGVACLTGNYGFFSGDENLALDQAIEGTESGVSTGAFALVAMVYVPPITDPNSVQFMVYGAGGQLVNEAELDTHGDNPSIPQNCINCHGSNATYDPATSSVIGARFLPFDPGAFGFSSEDGYTRADQAEPIRLLNQIVSEAGLSAGSRELLDGWYGGSLDIENTAADTSFVPEGWRGSIRSIETYANVIAPYCRACHASRGEGDQGERLDFTAYDEILAPLIGQAVCGVRGEPASHRMPSAQAVARELWSGPARAYLVDLFDVPGSCAP